MGIAVAEHQLDVSQPIRVSLATNNNLLPPCEAQARIRKAEAEAIAIEKITEAVGKSTNPANYLLAQKYIQMMEELAQGDKTKTVFLPFEATNMLGSLGGIKELFKETGDK
jgi:regulator of protease activity HflC (stomatin/prohibitin superfamily)